MDDDQDYVWKKLASETAFRGPFYSVSRDHLLHPSGEELDYFVVRYPREAIGVVPVDDRGRILLVQQWRHPVERLSWEIPAGGIEKGESKEEAARRELREETGYAADEVKKLYRYHPTIGSADQTFNLFVARTTEKIGEHDPKEIHAIRWFERSEIEEMIARNELVDGMSLMAILFLTRLGKKP